MVDPKVDFLRMIARGHTINEVAEMHGIVADIYEIQEWLEDLEFYKEYMKATKARAKVLAEEALTIARKTRKESAAADKLRVDTLKWLAALADHENFSGKIIRDDDDDGIIIVDTGIARSGEVDYELIKKRTKEMIRLQQESLKELQSRGSKERNGKDTGDGLPTETPPKGTSLEPEKI